MTPEQAYHPAVQFGALQELARSLPEVDALYLFGSHAEGCANTLSDTDLGVLVNDKIPTGDYFDLLRRYNMSFAEALGTDRVDVVVLNAAPAHLAFQIISPRRILFERDPARRIEFEVAVTNRFLDFRPFLETRRAYVKRQLLDGKFFG